MADKKDDTVALEAVHAVAYGTAGAVAKPGDTFRVSAVDAEWLMAQGAAKLAPKDESL